MAITVTAGAMVWYNFSTSYQEIEKMTDFTPLVERMQKVNEENMKKLNAEISKGQGGKFGAGTSERKISGQITLPDSVVHSKSVVYVALLNDSKQDIEQRFLQGDIIDLAQSNNDKVRYSIPLDFETSQEKYTLVVFLDNDGDYKNGDSDFVKSIKFEKLNSDRIQYFDIVLN